MAITKRATAQRAARAAAIEAAAKRAERDHKGGVGRWEGADPDEALATRRRAAAEVNGPVGLARRLAKAWPNTPEHLRTAALRQLVEGGVIDMRELVPMLDGS